METVTEEVSKDTEILCVESMDTDIAEDVSTAIVRGEETTDAISMASSII
jgi:ribonuclease HII